MKLIHTQKRVLTGGLLITSLLTAGAVAAFPERPAIEAACLHVADRLTALQQQHPDVPCQGDIAIAATYLKTAAMKIHYQRFAIALTDLGYGKSELQAISTSRPWCRSLAAEATPFIEEVRDLKAQVAILARVQE
ncbi:hypothetical protein [Legionella tunisiensis]|uniref:hypothetical protein n=1 Tax=Legionella tunisiensis TaxID=1034944 RepID=UPI0002E8E797|nr:hypothetical protein [Legionella tunisiensis]